MKKSQLISLIKEKSGLKLPPGVKPKPPVDAEPPIGTKVTASPSVPVKKPLGPPPGVKAKPPVIAPPAPVKKPLGPPPGVKAKPPIDSEPPIGTKVVSAPKGVPSPPPPPPPALPKKGFFSRIFKEEEDVKKSVPSDVANLEKAQSTSTALLARQKSINSIAEFPGAFETWFKTLGYEPGKITKGTAIRDVNAVLTKLGYK